MNSLWIRRSARILKGFIIAAVFALATSSTALAQQSGTPPPSPTPSTPPSQPRGGLTTSPPNRPTPYSTYEDPVLVMRRSGGWEAERERKRLIGQFMEDFERIQIINNEQIIPGELIAAPNYASISEAMAEIKKRASRIKANLMLPLSKKKKQNDEVKPDESNLDTSLLVLSRLIKSFTENPAFFLNTPNDKELRSEARRDLEGIIKLSDSINKVAKKLSTAAGSRTQ